MNWHPLHQSIPRPALTVTLTAALAMPVAVIASVALPPLFGPGKQAHIEQTGDRPVITVVDTDQDGVYDAAQTTESSISTNVAAQCNEGNAVAPSGLVGIGAGGNEWTAGYFAFQSEPWHQQQLITVGLPDNNADPEFPALKTNDQKEANFSDYIDFTKSNTGRWIDTSGKVSINGLDQGGNYSGHFRAVGTSVAFNSNTAMYDFDCR